MSAVFKKPDQRCKNCRVITKIEYSRNDTDECISADTGKLEFFFFEQRAVRADIGKLEGGKIWKYCLSQKKKYGSTISTFIYGSWSLRYQEHVFLHKGSQDGTLNEIGKHARPNVKRALIKLISSCLQFFICRKPNRLSTLFELNWFKLKKFFYKKKTILKHPKLYTTFH